MTPRQILIKELLDQGMNQTQISRKIRLSRSVVHKEIKIIKGQEIRKPRSYRSPDSWSLSHYQIEDLTIKNATSKQFTNEQMALYEQNKTLKRSELAKLLKIDRLSLNFIIDRIPQKKEFKEHLTCEVKAKIINDLNMGIKPIQIVEQYKISHSTVSWYYTKFVKKVKHEAKI